MGSDRGSPNRKPVGDRETALAQHRRGTWTPQARGRGRSGWEIILFPSSLPFAAADRELLKCEACLGSRGPVAAALPRALLSTQGRQHHMSGSLGIRASGGGVKEQIHYHMWKGAQAEGPGDGGLPPSQERR